VVRVMLELSLRILGQGNACMTSSIRPHAAQEEAVSMHPLPVHVLPLVNGVVADRQAGRIEKGAQLHKQKNSG
jgi:hypothetical protein